MQALIGRGGKRLRPHLLYVTYAAYGGQKPDKIIDVGVALELHHQFLLTHDDLIDSDTERYGGPNIVGAYLRDNGISVRNTAQAMSLLAGDLLFTFSNQAIIGSNDLSREQKVDLLALLQSKNVAVAYGEQLDVYNVGPGTASSTEKDLLLIHSLKCAAYTTQLPMQCAALLRRLDASECKKIDEFAVSFGVLIQLIDDYSDYFHAPSVVNDRPKYRDFRQGKLTFPLRAALTRADRRQVKYLKSALGTKNLPDAAMETIVKILEASGARQASRDQIEAYYEKTLQALDRLSPPSDQKQPLMQLIKKFQT